MYLLSTVAGGKDKDMYFNQVEFGKRVRDLRKKQGMTQESLAEDLNASVEHLSRIEHGKDGVSIDLILEIANRFEVSTDYLLTGDDLNNQLVKTRLKRIKDEISAIIGDMV